jgi:hypothetical protein
MFVRTLHRLSGSALITFPMLALLAAGSGYFQAPQPDEGSAAHVFQLSIAALVPTILLFAATADRRQPFPGRLLAYAAIIVAIAFGALFYLERVYHP